MCRLDINCLCHLLEPAILGDQQELLKTTYFDRAYIPEAYLFLKDSYSLLGLSEATAFNDALSDLIATYVRAGSLQEVNIAGAVRSSLLQNYDDFCENEGNLHDVRESLCKVVNYVEHLVYSNLVSLGINEYLQPYKHASAQQNIAPVTVDNDSCCHCALF